MPVPIKVSLISEVADSAVVNAGEVNDGWFGNQFSLFVLDVLTHNEVGK